MDRISKGRDKHEENLDLSQQWLRHLRESNKKSTITTTCPFCTNNVPGSFDNLYQHVLIHHPNKVPAKEERERIEKFKQSLRAQPNTPITSRPSRDDASTKPHEELSAIEADSWPQTSAISYSKSRLLLQKTPLTAVGLQDLTSQFRRQDGSISHYPVPFASNKKRAIGHGRSPTSSVRTTHSHDSQRPMLNTSSPLQASRAAVHLTDKQRDLDPAEILRPATIGKRLFEPDYDSPFITPTNLPPDSKTRPRSSPSQRRNQQSIPSVDQSQAERIQSGGEPGTIPASILNMNSLSEYESLPDTSKIVRQPETRPISQEQLVAEVKGIYAGLVMVEGKCIQVDAKQAALARDAPSGVHPKLNNEQWQALIALHRTLLHEHHDFFLASQHPSATPAVRRLAMKYAMPARLWRHGIHSFLELLRNRLPESLDHMLAFIYLAYSMMTLLYETVPAFEETWIECLGDLGRYRMAIEDDDIRDREVWTQVARQWYLKASDRSPETGRLYHHLAILARPNALQQLFFYYKAISVPQPFIAARESILTLLEPVLNGKQTRRLQPIIYAIIKVHAILFMNATQENFSSSLAEYMSLLDAHIGRVTQKYLEQGYYIAIANCLALLGFGVSEAIFYKALKGSQDPNSITGSVETSTSTAVFDDALRLFIRTIEINLGRIGDPNILSFLHVTMVFMVRVSRSPEAMQLLVGFPWPSLVTMLNTLLRFYHNHSRIESDLLPVPEKDEFRPTPEEFALRGLFWTEGYFPPGWFQNKNIEDENQSKEDPSMNTDYRPERILWLGCQLAKSGKHIRYSPTERKFSLPGSNTIIDVMPMSTLSPPLGADSPTESTADTATIIADPDDMSFASHSSTSFTEDAETKEPQILSTWSSQGAIVDNSMEVEEDSIQTTMDMDDIRDNG